MDDIAFESKKVKKKNKQHHAKKMTESPDPFNFAANSAAAGVQHNLDLQ